MIKTDLAKHVIRDLNYNMNNRHLEENGLKHILPRDKNFNLGLKKNGL